MSAEREKPPPLPPPMHNLSPGLGHYNGHGTLVPVISSSSFQDQRFISVTRSSIVIEDELMEARNKIWELENIEGPVHFSFYRQMQPLLQEGPTCGLVALSMASSCTQHPISVEELFMEAKTMGYTNHGEMFSVDNMAALARTMLRQSCRHVEILHSGLGQDKEYIIQMIANGSVLLIPYDADRNHSPCCRRGHKAHWAAVSGVVRSTTSCHLVARQGKSRHLGLWRYEDFQRSNENLVELDPTREDDGRVYVVPNGGVAVGLGGRAVLLHDLGMESMPPLDDASRGVYVE